MLVWAGIIKDELVDRTVGGKKSLEEDSADLHCFNISHQASFSRCWTCACIPEWTCSAFLKVRHMPGANVASQSTSMCSD